MSRRVINQRTHKVACAPNPKLLALPKLHFISGEEKGCITWTWTHQVHHGDIKDQKKATMNGRTSQGVARGVESVAQGI